MEHELLRLSQFKTEEERLDFVMRTYPNYRRCLMQSRKRGFTKPHHASLDLYRRGFIESCVVFRGEIYGNTI